MYALIAVLLIFYRYLVNAVIVEVEQGQLRGARLLTVTGNSLYYSFKGIPYAAPPVGKLRFQAPQSAEPWYGIRNATQHGNICVQVDAYTQELVPGSEDCLYLNVYTPNLIPTYPLSVLFFIHGGAFKSGSGNDDWYGPDFIIDQNLILVTINYRLAALGFLSLLSKDLPGNAGLKDQVAALKWVRRNIARFGGNPNLITIIGQSVGGLSCTLHLFSPMSRGLFRRAIPISGTYNIEPMIQMDPKRKAFAFGKALGYETENTTALFKFFRSVPAFRFFKSNSIERNEDEFSGDNTFDFTPVVEEDFGQERFLIESPDISITNGKIYNADLMIGYEETEALLVVNVFETTLISKYNRYPEMLTPALISYLNNYRTNLKLSDSIKKFYFGTRPISINTMAEAVKYESDNFVHQILRFTKSISILNSQKTYLFRSSGVTERNIFGIYGCKYGISGSAHNDILMYLFHANMYKIPINISSISYKMIEERTKLLFNFCKYGNPTPDRTLGVTWQEYNPTTQIYLDIGYKLLEGVQPEAAMLRFWESIYNRAGVQFYYVNITVLS